MPAIAITSLPTTISAPGVYVLTANHNFTASGAAITVAANDVVLDLNGFTLSAPQGSQANGIMDSQTASVSGLTVRNGIITGFKNGVWIEDPKSSSCGCQFEGLLVYNVSYCGIYVCGRGQVVRRNHIVGVTGAPVGAPDGIFVAGQANAILDNDVVDVHGSPGLDPGNAIHINVSTHTVIENNRISAAALEAGSAGIRVENTSDALVLHNRIFNRGFGILFVGTGAAGRYGDNVTLACQTPFSGGTDIGNNH